MTNSDRLQEIRERADKATPGPWKKTGPWYPIEPKTRQLPDVYSNVQTPQGSIADCWPWTDHEANAEFIAASREDIPYLLQLVTEQQREIEELREELDGMAKTSGRWIAAAIEAGVSPSVTTEAKVYRKQERPI